MASPPSTAPTAEELVRELVHELAVLIRCEMQLAEAERRPRYRELLGETAYIVASGFALFFAAVAFTWASWFWLAKAMPVWVAALVIACAYAAGGLLLLRTAPARSLRQRLARETREEATAIARAEQAAAVAAAEVTVGRIGNAVAREVAARVRGSAEHEAELLVNEIAGLLHPVALLERLVGRARRA